jgi:hypothetical protein
LGGAFISTAPCRDGAILDEDPGRHQVADDARRGIELDPLVGVDVPLDGARDGHGNCPRTDAVTRPPSLIRTRPSQSMAPSTDAVHPDVAAAGRPHRRPGRQRRSR